ncbi:TRA2B [Cordylochernes scorpioides]|uniref:TRA2B n=1 Tax=Cordylochernes scorpioides TaxID=51811 RepID=A0ABY6KF19_9ARAC|nr:TRA2B [Cordylochernes scorpioides]
MVRVLREEQLIVLNIPGVHALHLNNRATERYTPSRSYSRSRSPSPYRRRRSPSPRYRQRQNPRPNNCIGVFGMSSRTDERDLDDFFSKFGEIENIKLIRTPEGRSRGFAFIYFRHLEDAEAAVEESRGQILDGTEIRVDFSTTNRPHERTPGQYMGDRGRRGGDRWSRRHTPFRSYSRSRSPSPYRRRHSTFPGYRQRQNPRPNNCIVVFGMSPWTDELVLGNFLSMFGEIETINLIRTPGGRSRGFAFVYFRNLEDAETAVEESRGYILDGAEIRVDFSITNRSQQRTPGQYMEDRGRRAATPDQLWQRVEAAWSAIPQEHIQSLFESMPRRVAAVISNNGGYSGY